MNSFVVPVLRVLAIFQVLRAWESAWMAVGLISHPNTPDLMMLIYCLNPFIYAGFAVFLWIGAPWLSEKMAKGVSDSGFKKIDLSFDEVFIIATVFAGLLILARVVPYLYDFVDWIATLDERKEKGWYTGLGRVGSTFLLYLLLSLFLIFTPRGLLRLVNFTRKAGV